MTGMPEKDFDAVVMMRKIRDDLVKKFKSDAQAETRDLIKIRKKYHIQSSESITAEIPSKQMNAIGEYRFLSGRFCVVCAGVSIRAER